MNHARGQVSVESLLLWTCLAGMLAIFIPVFTHAMDAYRTQNEVNQFDAFAREMEEVIHALTFASAGSREKIEISPLEKVTIATQGKNIVLTYESEFFSKPKQKIIATPWEITLEAGNGKDIFLTRTENTLILQK